MRPWRAGSRVWWGMGLALGLGLGCNAIAGLHEGDLVVTDAATANDGATLPDAGSGDSYSVGDGAAGDSTMPPSDSSSSADSQAEAAPVAVTCSVNAGSIQKLDDLSVDDDAGLTYQHGILLAPLPSANDSVFVLIQPASDYSDVWAYEVSFGELSSKRVSLGASSLGNVRLLGITPTPGDNGYAVLTTAGTGVQGESTLQIIGPLASFDSNDPPATTSISPVVLDGGAFPNGASVLSPQSGVYDWILTGKNQSTNTSELVSGTSANGGVFEVLAPQNVDNGGVGSLFELDGNLYDIASGIDDAGSTILTYPDTLTTVGTQAPVGVNVPNVAATGILTSHVSAIDSTRAALLAATIDTSGNARLWSARLLPAQLQSITVGLPQFTAGSAADLASVPFNNGSTFAAGDQAFIVGPPQGGGNDLLALWIGDEGRIIASGTLVTRSNNITLAGGYASSTIGEVDASFFVAWVEEILPDSGPRYDQLWAAEATCKPSEGD